ncbi:hypothetical protein GCM10009605_54360 [Nocardiopsis composta]
MQRVERGGEVPLIPVEVLRRLGRGPLESDADPRQGGRELGEALFGQGRPRRSSLSWRWRSARGRAPAVRLGGEVAGPALRAGRLARGVGLGEHAPGLRAGGAGRRKIISTSFYIHFFE